MNKDLKESLTDLYDLMQYNYETLEISIQYFPYHLKRLNLAINSWFYWINIPEGKLQGVLHRTNRYFISPNYSRNYYWSFNGGGKTIAVNF
jgi:hypothetical protein